MMHMTDQMTYSSSEDIFGPILNLTKIDAPYFPKEIAKRHLKYILQMLGAIALYILSWHVLYIRWAV